MKINATEIFSVPLQTRIPFQYGIATLTEVPYVFVSVSLEIEGRNTRGTAADVLPPKWFTKNPHTSLAEEIEEMQGVIEQACEIAKQACPTDTLFELWQEIYEKQMAMARQNNRPPLLSGFGVSLVERALIDAYCRATNRCFAQSIQDNSFGVDLGLFHASLTGTHPGDYLPAVACQQIAIRHTVGLADPLVDADITPPCRLHDGLPQSLADNIRYYGLTHFKIKLPADLEEAIARLKAIGAVILQHCREFVFTLDGNEFFTDVAEFQNYWRSLSEMPQIADFMRQGLLLVEQPLHRDVALSDSVARALSAWTTRPTLIIDESDGELHSFARALQCGYQGTSHKNCKGVFKGIAHACKVAQENQRGQALLLTGEDLMNVGPVALLQDLAVGATLGLTHMERNGHHYVAGLSAFSQSIQDQILSKHPDLYRLHTSTSGSFPTLAIQQGHININSVIEAPFGYDLDINFAKEQTAPGSSLR